MVVSRRPVGIGDGEVTVVEVPELHPSGIVAAFHAAVKLWAPGRQHVQGDMELSTRLLEVAPELAAAVDLFSALA